jgi:hypothetical protein
VDVSPIHTWPLYTTKNHELIFLATLEIFFYMWQSNILQSFSAIKVLTFLLHIFFRFFRIIFQQLLGSIACKYRVPCFVEKLPYIVDPLHISCLPLSFFYWPICLVCRAWIFISKGMMGKLSVVKTSTRLCVMPIMPSFQTFYNGNIYHSIFQSCYKVTNKILRARAM